MAFVPGVSAPSSITTTGTSVRHPLLNGYLFNAGINAPEISQFVTEKYKKKYKMTALLNRIGAYKPVSSDTFSWSIQDRQRKSATVGSGDGTGATLTLVLSDIDYTASETDGYFVVGDVFRTETGILGRVNSVSNSGSDQSIVVSRVDGSNWAAADIADGEKIGHLFNAFEEGSDGPKGRLSVPESEYNYTQIFRRGLKISGSALTQKAWVNNGEAWYFQNEDYMFEEFAYDQELALMFGVRSSVSNRKTSQGIWDRVVTNAGGQVVNFASGTGISETDLQSLITPLNRQAGSDELLLLCGSDAITDLNIALKPYYMNGGVDFGSLGQNLVGLDVAAYKFAGKTLRLMHYPLFDDDKALQFTSTPTATKVNFRHVALALDMGDTDNGEPLISMCYRQLGDEQRKFKHKIIAGMHGNSDDNGGMASNSFDGFEVQVLSEVGFKIMLPNQSGALVPTS